MPAVPTSYLDLVFRSCQRMLRNTSNMGAMDHSVATKILLSVLHNCKGRVS